MALPLPTFNVKFTHLLKLCFFAYRKMDPLASIVESCEWVAAKASSVCINMAGIEEFSNSMESRPSMDSVTWDAEGWHYCKDVESGGGLTCQYIFVMDALNFCFWPTPELEYDTLAMSLKEVLEKDPGAFSATKLATINAKTLNSWFPKDKQLPNVDERVLRLRELGEALAAEYDGLAINMVKAAKNSARKLVQLLLAWVPGFRDTSIYRGRLVHLYKRVQILVGDVWAAYGRQKVPSSEGKGIFCFEDIASLTMFADYRVPQILREMNILEYSEALGSAIDKHREIPVGSEEEVEIRACTVVAVQRLQQSLAAKGVNLLVIELDWLLWQKGEATRKDIRPHHRTLTIYY